MRRIGISAHPPPITIKPWFPLCLRVNAPGTSFNIANLQAALASQIGVPPETFSVRLQRVRIWGGILAQNATGALQPLNVVVYDLFANVGSSVAPPLPVLEQYVDYPNQVSRAKVAFEYSDAQKQVSITVNAGNSVPLFVLSGMGANSVMYIDLLWRESDTAVSLALGPLAAAGESSDDYDDEFPIDDEFTFVKTQKSASIRGGGRRVAK